MSSVILVNVSLLHPFGTRFINQQKYTDTVKQMTQELQAHTCHHDPGSWHYLVVPAESLKKAEMNRNASAEDFSILMRPVRY